MEFICTKEDCKHTFHPHSFIAFRHPNNAKCPKCKTKAVKTEKGREEWKEYHAYKNKRDFETGRL